MFFILICLVAHLISVGFSQSCICDLVQRECEVNCCCDPDCNVSDISVFSYCININTNITNLQCSYEEIAFPSFIQTTVQVFQQGLFCLESDRFLERNTFVEPSCAPANCFDNTVGIFSFTSSPNVQNTRTFYQAGDVIYARYSSVANTDYLFSTPSSGFSNICQDSNPVKFFESRTTSCSRVLTSTNIQSICTSALHFETYSMDFQILGLPPPSTNLISITIVGCIVDGVLGACTNASFVTDTCENAVTSASYILTTNGDTGITSANVTFILENILVDNSVTQTQTFSVTFSSEPVNTEASYSRSGNPGYIVGNPLLSAAREEDSSISAVRNIFQNSVLGVEISLLQPEGTGLCSTLSLNRLAVVFGVDRRTGCQLAVSSSDNCNDLATLIQKSLDGSTFDSFNGNGVVFVGTYGNSNIDNLLNFVAADWVRVVRETYPVVTSNTNGCTLSLSSEYEIIYVQTGSISNPQAKILGVRYSYSEPQFLKFLCPGSTACNQMVEVFTSVTFIDISPAPVSFEREQPDINARLPADFFYPLRIP